VHKGWVAAGRGGVGAVQPLGAAAERRGERVKSVGTGQNEGPASRGAGAVGPAGRRRAEGCSRTARPAAAAAAAARGSSRSRGRGRGAADGSPEVVLHVDAVVGLLERRKLEEVRRAVHLAAAAGARGRFVWAQGRARARRSATAGAEPHWPKAG
jgi:hypothetical protein